MGWKAGDVVGRRVRGELVEQQEGVESPHAIGPNDAVEFDPSPVGGRLSGEQGLERA